ncbi:hypothetical protein WJX72_003434 [[Myrmecia] bisecta]|uniref:Fungal lipase-type domain-containing protein n=1 Tax=[Myrmecia] bisecta TaxID=41462 RepID=A0AAW1PL50_9CHLO
MLAERIMYKLFDALAFSSPSGAPPPSIPAAPASTQQKPAQVRPLNTTADVESAQTETQLQLDSSGMGKQTSSHPSAAHKPPEEDTLSHLSTSSSFSGHYNPRDDVILTLETISSRETRGLLFHIKVTTTAATVLLVLLTILKLSKPENYFTCRHRLVLLNLIVGALCLAGMLYCCAIRALSLWWARKMNRHWARRRAYIVTLTTLELTVTTLNLIFFLSANAYVLATGCTWFSNTVRWLSFAQWTCWNTLFLFLLVLASNTQPWLDKQGKPIGRLDATLADAPVTVHASKLILWVVYEALLITAFVYKPHKLAPGAIGQAPWQGSPCDTAHFICGSDPVNTAVVAVLVSITLFYLLVSLLTTIKSLRRVMRLPYQDYRMANVALRLQLKLRGPGVALFIASLICLCLIRLGSCRSFLFIWLGLLPMQLVQTTIAAVASHISNPRCMQGKDDPVLQVWLQEHAWCERDMERRKAIRRSSVPGNQSLDNEPMFCFETALKMFYWSSLVYTFQEISPAEETTVMNGNSADAKAGDGQAEDSKAVDAAAEARSLDLAMSLYQLQHFELIWEKKLDTKCLVAWNNNVVVLSFRGTASMANACADIKFWWAAHPPKRGRLCMLNRPMVHSGFLDSWLANGLNLRVVECINRVLNGKGVDRLAIKVLVTGHSLGGALATLAAYDIRKGCNLGAHNVVCLTFGAPRTGNHAFAWDYNKIVPHTWHVINDQDLVTRKGKVFIMYKRPGQRVLISRLGDLIVRPSWIEVSIRQRGGGSVAMHLLMNYKAALAAVCTAQFTKKGSRRGMQGVLDLMLDEPVRKLLALAGIDHDTVQRLQRLAKLGKRGRKALARAGGKHAKWCPAHAAAAAMGVSSDHTWKPTRLRRLDEAAADAAVAAADESLELEDFPEAEAERVA